MDTTGEAVNLIIELCNMPRELHPAAEQVLRDAIAGHATVTEFRQMFHLFNSDYLQYVRCVAQYLT
jgi:hypothetical protein